MEGSFPFFWIFSWTIKERDGELNNDENDEQVRTAIRTIIENARESNELWKLSMELAFHEGQYEINRLREKIEKVKNKQLHSYNERYKIKYILLKQEMEEMQTKHKQFKTTMNEIIRERERETQRERRWETETNDTDSEFA